MRPFIQSLRLTDFRSYSSLDLAISSASVVLYGPNGAGKTNLLEAVSLLSPGRGIRRAKPVDLARRCKSPIKGELDQSPQPYITDEDGFFRARAWGIVADIVRTPQEEELDASAESETHRIAVGQVPDAPKRKINRVDGTTVPSVRLSDYLSQMWLTPAQDRLFMGPASERRKFLDRFSLVHAPTHGQAIIRYEKARSERNRLLSEGSVDVGWYEALEADLAQCGARIATARAKTVTALSQEIATRPEGAFPKSQIALEGEGEALAVNGAALEDIEEYIAENLRQDRSIDQRAGRTLRGVHRSDLKVVHALKSMPAQDCSTGEQKALLIGLFLAHARAQREQNPILLLDEMAAHLDVSRRAALIEEVLELKTQIWMTGTDAALFEAFEGRAQCFHVSKGQVKRED